MEQNEVANAQGSPILAGYLTKKELARQLGRSERSIDRWELKRIGPPRVRIGTMVLFRVESVLEWLAEQEQSARRRRSAGRANRA